MAGTTGTARLLVAAPAAQVWERIADVTALARWSPENTAATWLDGATGPAVGARFRGSNKRGWARWSTTCTVTESVPGQVFAFDVGKRPDTRWRYELHPAAGGVEVVESYALHHAVRVPERVVTWLTTGVWRREDDLVDGMNRTLAALKADLEGVSAG